MITAFGILFGLTLGAIASWFVFRDRRRNRAARAWPGTAGRIVESRVEAKTLPGDRPTIRFAPRIVYEYAVNGRAHRSERIAFDEVFWSLAALGAAAKVAGYPAGAEVTVYYNPQRPEEAVLERNP
jgi:Protein of unknown function (DUF3592)